MKWITVDRNDLSDKHDRAESATVCRNRPATISGVLKIEKVARNKYNCENTLCILPAHYTVYIVFLYY